MTDAARTHYLNADFDLGLRPRPARRERPSMVRQVRELSVQAVLGASAADAALIRTDSPDEFLDHLDTCGFPVPRVLLHPRLDPLTRFRPFGWSAEAIELNCRHDRAVEHPGIDTIARVNSRSRTLEFEAELCSEGAAGEIVRSLAGLEAFLFAAAPATEWLVKAEHGNAGLANRRLRSPRLSAVDRRFVERLFAEDDVLLVEPWLTRERDWCVVFGVPFTSDAVRIHEVICTADGALIGSLFEPDGPADTPWIDRLCELAERTAGRLTDGGYFGPACFDAFSWRDGGGIKLRELADLNCRLSVSDWAHRWWRQFAPDRACYYRFFNRRKLKLPGRLSSATAALGEQRFDRARRRGILLASPLQFGKLAVFIVAENRTEVFELEAGFRERFES